MTILNLYQLLFVLTIVGVAAAGYWAKKHMPAQSDWDLAGLSLESEQARAPAVKGPAVKASLEFVQEHIKALDVLFDDHVLSVDEYVELRKRISSGQTV